MTKENISDMHYFKNGLSLKTASEMLGIPASTMRYWDKEGLVTFERNQQNDYRHVSPNTLLDLIDVLDYREMEIPLSKIKQIPQMAADELLALLDENRVELQAKIKNLQKTLAKIDLKEQALKRLNILEKRKPTLVYRQMPPIYKVDLRNTEDVKKSLVPFQSASLFRADNKYDWKAGIWTKNSNGEVIRPADKQPMPYLNGLMYVGRETNDGNADKLIYLAKKLGYRSQYVIYQYLGTIRHPNLGLCDFHEYWMEIVQE